MAMSAFIAPPTRILLFLKSGIWISDGRIFGWLFHKTAPESL
jgi:hypothetical protein